MIHLFDKTGLGSVSIPNLAKPNSHLSDILVTHYYLSGTFVPVFLKF